MIPKKVIRPAYGRIKIEPMTNSTARNQTFRKRKTGLLKKANELSTLCGVKVCVVINSCDNTETEFWPSREGAEAVHSAFMGVLPEERCKKMYDQERHLEERIQKGQAKAMRLQAENREIELREVMFDLFKGETLKPHHYDDPCFIGELNHFIGDYVKNLSHRIEFLEANGEPVPPNVAATDASGPVVGDANPFVVGTEGLNHFNTKLLLTFMIRLSPCFMVRARPMFYGSNQDMYTGLNHDQGQSSNQYPNSNQSFVGLLMGQPQQMSDGQDPATVASMDDKNNGYYQLPITSQMLLTTTTAAAADLSGHRINNGWLTRFGLD
ncbi:BnaAnng35010D [Brassica napus]|uniref:BnaAnng35010D protein n=1 Tax=Brassica napus TaxID=3708 RepID=A0A078JYS0_BRANA|nr:BnaAnng35010D [Brassica napus]